MTTAFEMRLERCLERKATQYPRISAAKDMSPQWAKRPKCCCYCINQATHRITLQVNHLRGEDETRDVCAEHACALPKEVTA